MYKTLYFREKAWGKPGLSQSGRLVGLSGDPAHPGVWWTLQADNTCYCGCGGSLLWKHMLGIDAFLQARHKVQGAHNPRCGKVSAISNNNSSLNRSAGRQSANECPCWRLEGHVYWVKFSHWVFPGFELLELAAGKSNRVSLWVWRWRTQRHSWHTWALSTLSSHREL